MSLGLVYRLEASWGQVPRRCQNSEALSYLDNPAGNDQHISDVEATRGVAQPGLARHLGVVEVAGSNPVAPTDLRIEPFGEYVKGFSH